VTATEHGGGGFFSQPKAVWAVAFAAVVSFMGLGLVDPILPAIASQLKASPSDVELLFTSYFAVTGVAMLITSAVASRIGPKRTMLAGLVLIIAFSALAGASNSIGAIVGLRAGWGLGNALFIATSLSVIIGSASGGVAGAVMIYEAALGLGISVGPLLGGELGGISWRGPFFGVAVLMTIGLVATAVFLDKTPAPARRISVLDPLRALRHRATRGSGLTAVFYNFGFFTLLAYTPFPLGLGAHELGYVFCGWGVMLAVFAVFVAPRVSRRFGDIRGLGAALSGLAAILVLMGALHASQTALIVCVVAAGTVLGLTNTLMTQVVMESAPVERPVATAAYSFVRFCGGAVAPFVAGKLGEHVSVQSPFYLGAGMTAVAVGVLWFYRHSLVPAAATAPETRHPAPATLRPERAPMVVALGGSSAEQVSAMTVPLARARRSAVHVLHVIETEVVAGESAVELETDAEAAAVLARSIATLRAASVPVTGELMRSVGGHADVAACILRRSAELSAGLIVVGPDTRRGILGPGVTAEIAANAPTHVVVINPAAGALGSPLPVEAAVADPSELWRN
jgi:MFS transporter, ACDE family, multidrug resistance protein